MKELLAQALTGDVDAYLRLARPAMRKVYGLALSLTRDDERAARATNAAMTAVYLRLDQARMAADLESWLLRTSTHELLAALRHQRGKQAPAGRTAETVPVGGRFLVASF